ncbi:MAG: NAD(P)-dependent glycerol-3-phosphate dehydrogenase [Puniceicoccales bacterium]|jgi:glycerol-3-phosphate dehydrogenase (NAD(P)+)|nr:NAD(P)-dependent glycerol-3-phosphate dehydrogenase [Puniceicoccales bacterium]
MRLDDFSMNIAIVGAGAWGTAMALHANRCEHKVTLFPRDQKELDRIAIHNENVDYFPGFTIPDEITLTLDFNLLESSDVIFIACPSVGLNDLCNNIKQYNLQKDCCVISLCKGLPYDSLTFPSDIIESSISTSFAIFAGPTYAKEVAKGLPTNVDLASKNKAIADIANKLNFGTIGIRCTSDIRGVELGSCLKNIYAIGAGILDGMELGDNFRCAYITSAIKEISDIGVNFGGQRETFYGASGLGDLMATCSGVWSRNRTFGERIGRGETPEKILATSISAIEGYKTSKIFFNECTKLGLKIPIMEKIYHIVYGGKSLEEADFHSCIL